MTELSVVDASGVRVTRGQRTRVLYFGDLDPSGWEMLPAMMKTLQEEMGLWKWVDGIRCALTPAQVEEHDLPHSIDALKLSDPRAQKYMAQFGDLAVELDALSPATLTNVVREAIEDNLDMTTYTAEQEQEAEERDRIANMKQDVDELLDDLDGA